MRAARWLCSSVHGGCWWEATPGTLGNGESVGESLFCCLLSVWLYLFSGGPMTLAPMSYTQTAPAKAIAENPWHDRTRKGSGGVSLTEVEVIETGTSGIWLLFLTLLQPLCIPEKPLHPPRLLQGANGACFFVKPFGIFFWRNWILFYEVMEGQLYF